MSGQEALDAVRGSFVYGRLDRRCRTTIGLILTDLSMPMIDGYQFSVKCRRLLREHGMEREV